MAATLIIERSRHRRYMARPFHLLVDGEGMAMLWRGRTVEVEVRPGLHDAVMEMDDYQSAPLRFRVADGEILRLRCEPNPKARFVSPWWSLLSRRMQSRHQRLDDPTGLGVVLLEVAGDAS
jgi:hypothetical protein